MKESWIEVIAVSFDTSDWEFNDVLDSDLCVLDLALSAGVTNWFLP